MRKKTLDAMLLYTMEKIKGRLNKDCCMWKTTAKALIKLN